VRLQHAGPEDALATTDPERDPASGCRGKFRSGRARDMNVRLERPIHSP
jgi:hypothetical protein